MYPPLSIVTPKRERELRRGWIREYKQQGKHYPRLRTIGQVVMTTIPEWAILKALKGLTLTESSIWLSRKYAYRLHKEALEQGIDAKVTYGPYRPCKICGRILLGMDAEERFHLDRQRGGRKLPCSPDCLEIKALAIESQEQEKRQRKRKGK